MTDDAYTGGYTTVIAAPTLRKTVDNILGAIDKWHRLYGPVHVIVWLNPAMRAAGDALERTTQREHITVRYSADVKPPTACALTGRGA